MGLFKLGPKAPPPPPEKTAEEIAAEAAAAAAAAAPKGVTREELDSILGERFERLMGQVAQIAGRPVQITPVPAPPPREPELTDEQIEAAILQGQGSAGTIRRLVTTEATKLARQIISEHIDPLRTQGLGAISNLVTQNAAATLPFYKKFQKEIDEQVAQLTPDQQINPLAIKLIHDAVVGANYSAVADEILERRTRQAAEASSGGNMPGGGAARAAGTSGEPDLEDFGGRAALRALEFKDGGAQDLDTFARKLGYKNFKEYAAIVPELEAQYRR